VKASRIAAMRIEADGEVSDFELVGFGGKSGAEWGKTPGDSPPK
jgi:hypothetical protein